MTDADWSAKAKKLEMDIVSLDTEMDDAINSIFIDAVLAHQDKFPDNPGSVIFVVQSAMVHMLATSATAALLGSLSPETLRNKEAILALAKAMRSTLLSKVEKIASDERILDASAEVMMMDEEDNGTQG